MLGRPFDGSHQGVAVGGQPVAEHLHGKQLGCGRLLPDCGGNGRPVAEPVDVVAGFRSVRPDGHATGYPTHVGVRRMNAAVHHRDADVLAVMLHDSTIVQPQLALFPFFHWGHEIDDIA